MNFSSSTTKFMNDFIYVEFSLTYGLSLLMDDSVDYIVDTFSICTEQIFCNAPL